MNDDMEGVSNETHSNLSSIGNVFLSAQDKPLQELISGRENPKLNSFSPTVMSSEKSSLVQPNFKTRLHRPEVDSHTVAPPIFHLETEGQTIIGMDGGQSITEAVKSVRELISSDSHAPYYSGTPMGVVGYQGQVSHSTPSSSIQDLMNKQKSGSTSRTSSNGRGARSPSREADSSKGVSSNGLGSASFHNFVIGGQSSTQTGTALLGPTLEQKRRNDVVIVCPLSPQAGTARSPPQFSLKSLAQLPEIATTIQQTTSPTTQQLGGSIADVMQVTTSANASPFSIVSGSDPFSKRSTHKVEKSILGVIPRQTQISSSEKSSPSLTHGAPNEHRPHSPSNTSWSHTALNGQDPMATSKSPTSEHSTSNPSTGRRHLSAGGGAHPSQGKDEKLTAFASRPLAGLCGLPLAAHPSAPKDNGGNRSNNSAMTVSTEGSNKSNMVAESGVEKGNFLAAVAMTSYPQSDDLRSTDERRTALGLAGSNNNSVQEGCHTNAASPRNLLSPQQYNNAHRLSESSTSSAAQSHKMPQLLHNLHLLHPKHRQFQFPSHHSLHPQGANYFPSNHSLNQSRQNQSSVVGGGYYGNGKSNAASTTGSGGNTTLNNTSFGFGNNVSICLSNASLGSRKPSEEERMLQNLRAKRQKVINNLIAQRNPAVAKAMQEMQRFQQQQQSLMQEHQFLASIEGMGSAQSLSGGGYYGSSASKGNQFSDTSYSPPASIIAVDATGNVGAGGGEENISHRDQLRKDVSDPLSTSVSADHSALYPMKQRHKQQRQMMAEREQRLSNPQNIIKSTMEGGKARTSATSSPASPSFPLPESAISASHAPTSMSMGGASHQGFPTRSAFGSMASPYVAGMYGPTISLDTGAKVVDSHLPTENETTLSIAGKVSVTSAANGMFFPAPIQLTPRPENIPNKNNEEPASPTSMLGDVSYYGPPTAQGGSGTKAARSGSGKRVSVVVPTYRDTNSYSISTLSQKTEDVSHYGPPSAERESSRRSGYDTELHAGGTIILTNTNSSRSDGKDSLSVSPKPTGSLAKMGDVANRFSISFSGWDTGAVDTNTNSYSLHSRPSEFPLRSSPNSLGLAPASDAQTSRALESQLSQPDVQELLPAEIVLAKFMLSAAPNASTSMAGFALPYAASNRSMDDKTVPAFLAAQQPSLNSGNSENESSSGSARPHTVGSASGRNNKVANYRLVTAQSSASILNRSPNDVGVNSIRVPSHNVNSNVHQHFFTSTAAAPAGGGGSASSVLAVAMAGANRMGLSMSDFNPSVLYNHLASLGGNAVPATVANLPDIFKGSVRSKSMFFTRNMSYVGRSMSMASMVAPNRSQRDRDVSVSFANNVPPTIMTTTSNYVLDDADGFYVLNNYILLTEAGQGQYGTVMIASSADSDKMKAIKIIPKSKIKPKFHVLPKHRDSTASNVSSNESRIPGHSMSRQVISDATSKRIPLTAFEREIAVMKKLRHRNIVRLEEVIDDPNDENLYLVMPYIEGGPIVRMEKSRCDPLDVDTIRSYTAQLLSAVAYLHRHQVVHCDIKPDNILRGANGMVYLADFGVSEMFNNDAEENLEKTRGSTEFSGKINSDAPFAMTATKGTPAFTAPEALTGKPFDGSAADMWAVGITLYVLLFGRLPHEGYSVRDLFRAIESDPIDLCKGFRDRWKGLKVEYEEILSDNPLLSVNNSQGHPAVSLQTAEFVDVESPDGSESARPRPSSTTLVLSPTNSSATTAAPTPSHPSARVPSTQVTSGNCSPSHTAVKRKDNAFTKEGSAPASSPISPIQILANVPPLNQPANPLSDEATIITALPAPKIFPKLRFSFDNKNFSVHNNPLIADLSAAGIEENKASPAQLIQSYLSEIAALHALMGIRADKQRDLKEQTQRELKQNENVKDETARRKASKESGSKLDVSQHSVASAPFSSPRPSHIELGSGRDTVVEDEHCNVGDDKRTTANPKDDTSADNKSLQLNEWSFSASTPTKKKRSVAWTTTFENNGPKPDDTKRFSEEKSDPHTVYNNFTFALPDADNDSIHFADLRTLQITEGLIPRLMVEIKTAVRGGKTSEGEVVFPNGLLNLGDGDEESYGSDDEDSASDTLSDIIPSSSSFSDDGGGDRKNKKRNFVDKHSRLSLLSIDSKGESQKDSVDVITTIDALGGSKPVPHSSNVSKKWIRQELLMQTAQAVLKQRVGKMMAAINLIRKLLTKDPAKRITAAEALRHPFITSNRWLGSVVSPSLIASPSPTKSLRRSLAKTGVVGVVTDPLPAGSVLSYNNNTQTMPHNANSTTHTHIFHTSNTKIIEGSMLTTVPKTQNYDTVQRHSSSLIPFVSGPEENNSPLSSCIVPSAKAQSLSQLHAGQSTRPEEGIVFTVGRNRNNNKAPARGLKEITVANPPQADQKDSNIIRKQSLHNNTQESILTPREGRTQPPNHPLPKVSPLSPLTISLSAPPVQRVDDKAPKTLPVFGTLLGTEPPSDPSIKTNDTYSTGLGSSPRGDPGRTSACPLTPQTTTTSSATVTSPRPRGKEGVAGRHRQTIRDAITDEEVASSTIGRNWDAERTLTKRLSVCMATEEGSVEGDNVEIQLSVENT